MKMWVETERMERGNGKGRGVRSVGVEGCGFGGLGFRYEDIGGWKI
jgi:hypothetical protein